MKYMKVIVGLGLIPLGVFIGSSIGGITTVLMTRLACKIPSLFC